MYKISVDNDNRFFYVELSGNMQSKELEAYTAEIIDAFSHFKQNEVLVLVSLERLDPVSQDNLSICIGKLVTLSAYIKKIAFIHKRFVTRTQQERIVQSAEAIIGKKLPAEGFSTKSDALKFLYE